MYLLSWAQEMVFNPLWNDSLMNSALHPLPLGFILACLLSFFLNVRGGEVLYLSFFMRRSTAKLWGQYSEVCPLPWTSCQSPHKQAQILIFICSLQLFSWHPFCLYGHISRSQNLKALPLSTNSTANHILSQMKTFASNLVDRICRGYFTRVCIAFSYFIRWLNLPSGRGSRVIAVLRRPLPKLTRWGPSAWTLRVLPVSIRSSGVLCEHMRAIEQ